MTLCAFYLFNQVVSDGEPLQPGLGKEGPHVLTVGACEVIGVGQMVQDNFNVLQVLFDGLGDLNWGHKPVLPGGWVWGFYEAEGVTRYSFA
jgi:hypothetical protein